IAVVSNRHHLLDFWHHLARGRAMVEAGQLVNTDLFTFTVQGEPFQDANWLSQLIYYRLYSWGGLDLVRVVNAAVLAVMMSVLVAVCRRASGSLAMANVAAAFTFGGLWEVLTIRPQTFSLLLFVLMYAALEHAQSRPWWLAAPPCLMALW